jgi:hypothetical protein
MGKHGFRYASAHRAAGRERGVGLLPDDRYLEALARDPAALQWLQQHCPRQYTRAASQLRQRGGEA